MDKEIEIPEGHEARIEGNKVILEPKESEDERIYELIYSAIKHGMPIASTKNRADALAYLEKQKDILRERVQNITANMLEDRIEGIQHELIEFLSNTIEAPWVDIIKSADSYTERIKNIIKKPKEQKPIQDDAEKEYVRTLKSLISDFLCGKDEVDTAYYQKIYDWLDGRHIEQQPTEITPNQFDGITYGMNGYVSEKPAEWSEEDEQCRQFAIGGLKSYIKEHPDSEFGNPTACEKRAIDWLESLRPQPKQEWSKEDNNIIEQIIMDYEGEIRKLSNSLMDKPLRPIYQKRIDFLKSLRPQSHWKPSEEQMKIFNEAVKHYSRYWDSEDIKILCSLYDDLKGL